MIRLNVFIETDGERRAALVEVARKLAAASLKDAGCVAYDLFESATRPEVLMICETWRDDASLAAHRHAPHFTTLVPRIESLGRMTAERFDF